MINELVLQYIQFAEEIRNDNVIAPTVKGTVLLQLAQGLNYLVPLASADQGIQQQQQMDQAQQQHDQQMQMAQEKHQADMMMAQQKHGLEIQKSQANHQLSQQQAQDNHVMKQQQQVKEAKGATTNANN